jgi:hypothetical protein
MSEAGRARKDDENVAVFRTADHIHFETGG